MSRRRHVGLGILAVGDDAAVLDPPDEFLHHGMVEAHDRETVERQVLDERAERLLDGVESLEVVEVLGIDVGHDRDVGGQFQESAVALVGFHHHPIALASPGVGAVGIDDAAVDHRRVEAAGVEQGGDERRRRGLAMRAGHRHAGLEAHEFGQHLGAPHHGQAPAARRDEFGVVAANGSRHHHDFRIPEMDGIMADRDRDPLFAQALHIGALRGVRALNAVAERIQHLGDPRHADTADADEMDGAEFAGQLHIVYRSSSMPPPRRGRDRRAAPRHPGGRRDGPRRHAVAGPRVVQNPREFSGQPIGRERLFLAHHGGTARCEDGGVGGLVLVEGVGKGNQNGGPSDDREFADRGGTRAGHDELRRSDPLGQVGKERRDLGLEIQPGIGVPHARLVLAAGLLDDPHALARCGVEQRDGGGYDIRHDAGALGPPGHPGA